MSSHRAVTLMTLRLTAGPGVGDNEVGLPQHVQLRHPGVHLDVVRQRAQLLFSDLPAHLEHLTITRKTVTGLADRLPAVAPDLPEHPDHPRVLAAFHHTTGPLRAKHVGEALGHELLPKNVEGTRAKRTSEALNESPSATCHSSGGACSS